MGRCGPGVRLLVLFWDNALWHVAQRPQRLVARYNRYTRATDDCVSCSLPIKASWLTPLEAVSGRTKRVVGLIERASMPALQEAVERRLERRNAWAEEERLNTHPSNQLLSA